MSHTTEHSSSWMTPLRNWWVVRLVQTDDADFSAAQFSPEGKLPLSPGTCWWSLVGERPVHLCGDTRSSSILLLALFPAMLEPMSLAQKCLVGIWRNWFRYMKNPCWGFLRDLHPFHHQTTSVSQTWIHQSLGYHEEMFYCFFFFFFSFNSGNLSTYKRKVILQELLRCSHSVKSLQVNCP